MRKKFLTILLSAILVCGAVLLPSCSNNTEKVLSDVLNNNGTFISEAGNITYLKDYKIGKGTLLTPIDAVPSKYVFVDMNNDGEDELVINISDAYGYYLVLHYDGQNVYGFEFNARSLLALKKDGSFMGSNGAASNSYCKLSFGDNTYTIICEAVKDSTMGKFEINGENVSTEALNEFINDWNLKPNVVWNDVKPAEDVNNNDTDINNNTVINLNDYISVNFNGKNLAGYASVKFNKEKFLLDHINNISFNKDNLQVYRELYGNTGKSAANDLLKYISVGLNKNDKLSNGDAIEVVWQINDEKIETYFNVNYTCSPQVFTVTDLPEAKTFDPFENLKVNFSSIAPYGVVNVYSYEYLHRGSYELSKKDGLSNGDIITVTYNCKTIADMIESYGEYPSCYEKTYIVSGLKAFPQSIDDISNKILSDIDITARKYFSRFQQETISHGIIVENYAIAGYAFIAPTVNVSDEDSRFYAIYKVDAKATYKGQFQNIPYYAVLEFNNPIIENGVCTMDASDYNVLYHTTSAAVFPEEHSATYIRADGFDTKEQIMQYLDRYIGSRSELVFQTYQ